MKAIVQEEYGAAGVLRIGDRPAPRIEPGWTVVELRAAALNWHDVLVRRGQYESPLPHTPGADGAGIDLATGEEVVILPSLAWGDEQSAPGARWEILGDRRAGTYAERVAVPSSCVAPKPRGLTWPEAASLPLVGVTVYRALFVRGRLRSGERLLVLGAGGGIATTAVALGSAIGAEVVVTSSDDGKISKSVTLGAVGGVRYDGADVDSWPESARQVGSGGGFDVVLDSVGTWSSALRALRPGGRLVALGSNREERAEIDVRTFYFGQYDLLGTTMGSNRDFEGLLKLLDEHAVPPPTIDRVLSLERAADAHAYLETGAAFGKVVLEI